MYFSVSLPYPRDGAGWADKVRSAAPLGCADVAFSDPSVFDDVDLGLLLGPFDDVRLRVPSVHMAYVKVLHSAAFLSALERTADIADRLGAPCIVAHPSRGRLSDVLSFLDDEISPLLRERSKVLCWELFDNPKRILGTLADMAAFCRDRTVFRVCYDVSHASGGQEKVEREVTESLPWIAHVHLSNRVREGRVRHLPVFMEETMGGLEPDLDLSAVLRRLAREGFPGACTLEYRLEFEHRLVPDALRLAGMFSA